MLISRSCVFHAMLTGAMAEISDIKIPDIEPLVFRAFLKYIYTEDTEIDVENATALLYTARKYGITSLEVGCTEFLDMNLSVDNACVIFRAAHCFDNAQLYKKALTLIKCSGERSLQSPGFLELGQFFVGEIVRSDDLAADEHVIFIAVNDWSEAECVREGREVTPQSKRLVLGEILYKIRFPIMKLTFLEDNVKESGLLTDTEQALCSDFAVTPNNCVSPFNHNLRRASFNVSKSRFVIGSSPWNVTGHVDAVNFWSSSDLFVLGCQLYGAFRAKGKYTYKVTSFCGDKKNGTSYASLVQERSVFTGEGKVFDVIFSRPVSVSAGEWYTLAVKIEGACTWSGKRGQDKVTSADGVQLRFTPSIHSTTGSDEHCGQIPSLIYKLHC